MATKQNMYVGKMGEAESIVHEINECVICWKLEEDGVATIAVHMEDKADQIRDKVSNMQGQLQVLMSGLDKNSPKKEKYQSILDKIDAFMKLYK